MNLDNIKDQIKDYELDFDQNEVWSNIEEQQKKGKRKFIFWLSSIFGFLLLGASLFYLIDKSDSPREHQYFSVNQTDITPEKKSDNLIERKTKSSELPNVAIAKKSKSEYASNQSHADKNLKSYDDNNENSTSVNSNLTSANNQSFEKNTAQRFEDANSTTPSDHIIDTNTPDGNSPLRKTLNQTSNKTKVEFASDEHSDTAVNKQQNERKRLISISKANTNPPSQENTVSLSKVDSKSMNSENSNSRDKVVLVDMNSKINLSPLSYVYNIEKAHGEILTYNRTEPLDVVVGNNVAIQVVTEYGILKRNLSLSDGAEKSEALQRREETEKPIDHFLVGLHITSPLSNSFYISSGLEFHHMTDQLDYINTEINPLDPDDLPLGAKNAYGYVISTSSGKYYNHLDLINIPVEIGAKWSISKLNQFVSVGTSVNINTSSRQLFINEFGNIEDNRNIKSSLNNSYMLKTGLTLELSSSLDWSLHAAYRYTPNVNTDASEYSQSYQSYMIGTGIAFKF